MRKKRPAHKAKTIRKGSSCMFAKQAQTPNQLPKCLSRDNVMQWSDNEARAPVRTADYINSLFINKEAKSTTGSYRLPDLTILFLKKTAS